jgi:hypothetical protein
MHNVPWLREMNPYEVVDRQEMYVLTARSRPDKHGYWRIPDHFIQGGYIALYMERQGNLLPYGMMKCCGTRIISNLAGIIPTEEDWQSFLCAFFQHSSKVYTYYFVVADYQLEQARLEKRTILGRLINQGGAYEVNECKNRYHGPATLHLYVWHTNDFDNEKISTEKFAVRQDSNYVPKWWFDLPREEAQKIYDTTIKENEIRTERANVEAKGKRDKYKEMCQQYMRELIFYEPERFLDTLSCTLPVKRNLVPKIKHILKQLESE